ncbi:MAG: hypothetical protein R3358_13310, partial [Woeseiaceae bacterium]|nr:hypothetical protein [Woeseiaceae bacterium]
DRIEVFDNDIADNDTANIIIGSYYATGNEWNRELAADYDPYPETIYIHGNRFSGGGTSPDGLELKALKLAKFGLNGSFPDVLWDGFVNSANVDENGHLLPEYAICLDNGDSELLNVDLGNDSENIVIGGPEHACSHTRLPPVVLEPPLG